MALLKAHEAAARGADETRVAGAPATRWWRYLLILAAIPLLFYPWPFLIATSSGYEHWSTSQWGPMLEYAYQPRGEHADVLIFGDSSAFIGVDPRLLNERFGVKSLVLPDTIGSIPVTGDAPLALYMRRNAAPRLLVLYFSPWNLDFSHIATVRLFEGEEMMLRHGSAREIARFTLHHPTEMLVFPFRLYSTFGPKMLSAALHHVNRERDTSASLGHADYNDKAFPALQAPCRLPAGLLAAGGEGSVQALVRKYTTPQTQVLVYLAPLPNCAGSLALADRPYPGLDAAAPQILPAQMFVGDSYFAHVEPAYVPAATAALERALAPVLLRLGLGTATSGR